MKTMTKQKTFWLLSAVVVILLFAIGRSRVRKTDSPAETPVISTTVRAMRATQVGSLDVSTDETGTRFTIAGRQTSIREHVIGLGPTQKWYAGN